MLARTLRTLRLLSLCTLVTASVSSVAHAAPCDLGKPCPRAMNAETARGLGLGTGSRASALSTSALAYNPAALVVGHLYHVEAAVDYMPEFHTVALGGAVVDSATAKVGAGVGLRGFLSGNTGVGGIDGRLALAFPFTDAISIGIGGRYLSLSQDQKILTGPSAGLIRPHDLAQGFTMDASFRVQPAQMLQLEVATFNFVNMHSAYAPLLVDASAALALGTTADIGFDFITDTTTYSKPTYTVGGGGELLLGNSVPLRAGYAVDLERKLHSISAGLGYTDRNVGFDISFQQQVKGGNDTRILGAFRYYVH